MPIAPTDILMKYSVSSASAGNTTAGSVSTSLGGYLSTTVVPDATEANILPDVTGTENAAENVDFTCIFVHNHHPTATLRNARIWVSADVAGGSIPAVAVDPIEATDSDSTAQQAVEIANKNTVPAGVGPFVLPLDPASALVMGDIGPEQCRAFWVRRTATNSGSMTGDGATFRIDGDTST